jgi:ribosomal protein S7
MLGKHLQTFFYTSVFYNRFLTKNIKHGKKERVENTIIRVFLQIARYSKIPVFFIFFELLEKQKCFISFRRIIKKKRTNLVPFNLRPAQQYWLAVSLLVKSIKFFGRKVPFKEKVYSCFSMYFKPKQRLFLKGIIEKQNLYALAIENRYLVHYR